MVRPNRFAKAYLPAVTRREYLTLIICVVISLGFVFSNNTPQVERLRAALVGSWAGVLQAFSWITALRDRENELAELRLRSSQLYLENAQLREAALENLRLRTMLAFKHKSRYDLISARVISTNREQFMKSVTVDVGAEEGVHKDMPVITPMGLAGRVHSVGKHTSIVQLVIDHNFRAACLIQRSRVEGILAYNAGGECRLTQVPKNSDVAVKDVVITSGYSSIFPPGLQVGIVTDLNRENTTLFMEIKVRPLVDFSRLEEIFIVTSKQPHSSN